jgi:hypothetical protein
MVYLSSDIKKIQIYLFINSIFCLYYPKIYLNESDIELNVKQK